MEEDIKVLEEFIEKNIKSILRTELNANELQAIENLIKGYKELETINKIQEYRISVIDERELILKSKLAEILKQRLKKYQDADDGQYIQEYLTRGELELVDRYKECSELLKILCDEDIYKIELDYIPKSKVREKIEEYSKLQEEMTNKNHQANNINDCYKYGDNAQKAYYKKEALQELLQEGDNK